MNYNDVTNFINKAKKFGSRLDLTRITYLLNLLGNPQDSCNFVHIAGTNGKGSVSCFMANILKDAGFKTGLFTSPFIYDFNERIQINNVPISDGELMPIMEKVSKATDQMLKDGMEHPTEFELITACAFLYFKEEKCDVSVLEVGLGGILDSTNVIKKPLCSVITSISLDHTEYLGNTIEEIAKNKCGIIKEQAPVVVYPYQEDGALKIIKNTAEEKNANVTICDDKTLKVLKTDITGNEFLYDGLLVKTALLGEYQIYNAITAINAAKELKKQGYKITDVNIKNGLNAAKWPARFEILNETPCVIADGSHNADGMRVFCKNAKKILNGKKCICVFGMLRDKEYDKCLSLLSDISDTVVVTEVDSPRYESAENLKNTAQKYFKNVFAEKDNENAMKKASEIAKEDDVIIALGSLYMMKNIKDAANNIFGK